MEKLLRVDPSNTALKDCAFNRLMREIKSRGIKDLCKRIALLACHYLESFAHCRALPEYCRYKELYESPR
jgi:hypothetical protein